MLKWRGTEGQAIVVDAQRLGHMCVCVCAKLRWIEAKGKAMKPNEAVKQNNVAEEEREIGRGHACL